MTQSMKHLMAALCLSFLAAAFSSCTYIMNDSGEKERIPQPPPGTTNRQKPWNESQKFEAEATLGPLVNPRR